MREPETQISGYPGPAATLGPLWARWNLAGVYVVGADGTLQRFRPVKAPTTAELTELMHTIAERVGRFLQRQGLLERDAENSYLTGDGL